MTTSADRPVNTISFKCTNEQMIVADALRSTFDPPTHSQSLRWLLSDPDVLEVISKKVRG